jgi:hypothetical protein
VPAFQERVRDMRRKLFDRLEATGGMTMPLKRPPGFQAGQRKRGG